jgi:PAS domain S-box-containing protein
MSWFLVFAFLVVTLGMGTAGFVYYNHQKEDFKEQRKNELLAIAELKVRQIEKWREERQRDAEIIFNSPFIAHQVEKGQRSPEGSELNQEVLSFMASLQMYGGYESVFLLDAIGSLRASVPTWRKPGGPSAQSLIARAIHERRIVFSDLYRDEAQDRILIDLFVPILLSRNRGNRLIGIMVLRTEPRDFLYPLIQAWPIPSPTAESLLVRREGDEIVFLNELRHQRNTALILRLPMSRQDLPSSMGLRGQQGVVEAVDYRGVKVLAAIQRIPDSPWILIAKIDQQEIYLPIRGHKLMLMIVGGLLILATGLIVALIWRQQGAVFREKQYRAELERQALSKHYESLTKYANDIILLYDHELRIVEANDRAVSSYGYTRDELFLLNAWDLRPPESKSILETTLKQAKDQKSLVFETVHQRKNGTPFPVEVSVRVIEVEGKEFHQSIIRDITERKQAEKAREKLIHELQEAFTKVKTLSGLLPICASCKKVRDDKGYWNQIETYIRDRSEAEFSHGICPECMKKLYPNFCEDEEGKGDEIRRP